MSYNYLKSFLELYWIRPESALLTAILAKNIPENYMNLGEVSADINCGDGTFSFILNGGILNNSFNLYESTEIKSTIIRNEDIYSHYDQNYNPKINQYANKTYSYGIDINDKMLAKAKSLNIYKKQLLYTGNINLDNKKSYLVKSLNGESLELKNSLDLITIFSSAYMYQNTSYLLNKINYLLKDNGTFILNIKTDSFRNFYEKLETSYPKNFSNYIERDMRNVLKSLHTQSTWENYFINHNFEIIEKKPTLQKNLTPFWTIGLRFLTPLLIKMSNAIENKENFLEIKNDFVNTFYDVLLDFYEEDISEASSYLYILRKK